MLKRLLPSIIALLLIPSGLFAQKERIFDSDEILNFELTFDMEKFLADRTEDAPYRDAVLSWKEKGEQHMLSVEIKVRGNYRRHKTICEFPPIRVKIPKKKGKETIFHKAGKMKLVPDCRGSDYVFREYLAYKTFNLLTDTSFQTRLVKVTYKDSAKVHDSFKQFGFLIEDEDKLAKRLDGKVIKKKDTVLATDTHRVQLGVVALFQYMIGNPDWSVKRKKNVKIIRTDSTSIPFIVPYDFDWSKAVDTPYALESMGEDFERREMPKLCFERKEIKGLIDKYQSIKNDLAELYKKGSPLSKGKSKETMAYFDEFYEIISDQKKVEEILTKGCPQR